MKHKKLKIEDFSKYIPVSEKIKLSNSQIDKSKGLVIPYGDHIYSSDYIAENVYRYIFIKSTKRICIMTPYIIIDNSLLEDIYFAQNSGVQIEIIVPQYWDHFIPFCVGRTFIKNLIDNGIKVYAYQKGFIHSKVCIGDSKFGIVGSVNFDYRSFYHHFECGAFLYEAQAIKEMQKDFDNTKKECKEITLEEYKKIPLYIKLIGRLFRIFAPLL